MTRRQRLLASTALRPLNSRLHFATVPSPQTAGWFFRMDLKYQLFRRGVYARTTRAAA